jgi:hypothetical protein
LAKGFLTISPDAEGKKAGGANPKNGSAPIEEGLMAGIYGKALCLLINQYLYKIIDNITIVPSLSRQSAWQSYFSAGWSHP